MREHRGFFVVLVFFFALFLSTVKGYSQTPCPDPVMIAEDGFVFNTIQGAYDDANLRWTDFTLLLVAETFNEDLIIDSGSVLLDGGYDCSFSAKTLPTGILGSITISAGAVMFDNIAVLSTPVCAFDSDNDGFTSIGSCAGSADDCDDNDANNFPGNPEVCDGLDNNCNGQIDDGLSATDADGDGYSAIGSCGGTADDCNDNDASIHPDAVDIPYDGIDQDCIGGDLTFAGESCVDCHAPASNWNNLHNLTTPPDGTCATCHAAPVYNVLSGHYGKTVRSAGNNMTAGSTIVCVSCHDADSNTHSGGVTLGNGSNFVTNKITAAFPNITCDTCHENRAADHAAGHTIELGAGDLSNGTSCGACHAVESWTEIEGVEHNVATNGAGSCATCHDSPRAEVQIAILNAANPTNCLDCHSDKAAAHGNVDHVAAGYVVLGATSCAACHDPGGAANATVDITHNGNCSLCHTTVPDLQPGIPAGGGDCTTCHTDTWETTHTTNAPDHTSIVTVGTLLCANCHSDPPPLVDQTDPRVHNGCASCHDANGSLISLAIGTSFVVGGDCAACHDYTTYSEPHGCTGCHGEPPTENTFGGPNGLIGSPSVPTGYSSAGAHAIHAGSSGYNFPCEYCHQGGMSETGLVLNDQLDIDFDLSPFEIDNVDPSLGLTFVSFDSTTQSFDGIPLSQPYQYSPGNTTGGSNTCANTYCHSDGTAVATRLFDDQIPANTSPSWEGTTTCESCHGYAPDYPSLSPKTNAHDRHIGLFYQGGINEDANPCHVCHYSTTLNGSTISNKSNHVNGQYDVAANPNIVFKQNLQPANQYPVSFTYNYDPRNSSCSNISCHTNLISTDHTWGYGTIPPEPPTPTGWYPEATIVSGNTVEVTVPGAPFGKIYVYWGANQGSSSFTSGNSVQHTYPNGTYEISVRVYDLDHGQHWYYWDSWPAEQSCDTCPSLHITVP